MTSPTTSTTTTAHVAMTLRSRADVATDNPGRYAKQLVAHLGHRVAFTTTGPTSTATLGGAHAEIIVGDRVLTLLAAATDPDALGLVEHVLGSHLERFGQRNELVVAWTRSSEGDQP